MNNIEVKTESFIIKIWFEELDQGSDKVIWRGHITHVRSGKQSNLDSLEQIKTFMSKYLMGQNNPENQQTKK